MPVLRIQESTEVKIDNLIREAYEINPKLLTWDQKIQLIFQIMERRSGDG